MHKKRTLAAAILLLFTAVLALSLNYITAEAEHRCTGESCPICHNIAACIGALTISGGALICSYVFYISCTPIGAFFFCLRTVRARTLVSLKVKLSR